MASPGPSEAQAIDAGLDVALTVFENGGATGVADRALVNVVKGLTGQRPSTVWRMDFVAVTVTVDDMPSSRFRLVGPVGVNLVRAAEATALAERVARERLDVAAVMAEGRRIRAMRPPYRLPVTVAAAAATSAFFSQLIGGDWGSFGIGLAAGGTGQLLRTSLGGRQVPAPAITIFCAGLSVLLAAAGLRGGLSDVVPATLISSVAYMIPGLPLVNGFRDVASSTYIAVGVQRIVSALVTFAFLAVALALGAAVAG